jgi:putative membrane protein
MRVRRQEQKQRAAGQPVPAAAVTPAPSQPTESDPKVKVAQHLSRQLFDHELSPLEQKAAAPAVHYGYGATVGALYGGLAEVFPEVGSGFGIPYGLLLWLGGAELALPALELTPPVVDIPAQKHASALATHFVYGIALDIGRRIIRRLL